MVSTRPIASTVRILLILVSVLGFGAYLSWSGWHGWLTGQILVRTKFGPDFVAHAAGPHAEAFQIEVWLQIAAGALLVLLGGGCLLALAFVPSARRRAMISAGDSAFTSSIARRSGWFLVLVLIALGAILLGAG